MNILRRILNCGKGSVLMEFVMILPVYVVTMGGVLWIGLKSLDTIGLRIGDHWNVWMAGQRFGTRTAGVLALQQLFPRTDIITTTRKRALEGEHSFIQFIGGKVSIMETRPDYIDAWINMSYTTTGEQKPVYIPELYMTSSRYGNSYTQYLVMRAKGSNTAKRHWDSSLLADKGIWKFNSSGDAIPDKWEKSVLDNARVTDDTAEEGAEPAKKKFYERHSRYVTWSK